MQTVIDIDGSDLISVDYKHLRIILGDLTRSIAQNAAELDRLSVLVAGEVSSSPLLKSFPERKRRNPTQATDEEKSSSMASQTDAGIQVVSPEDEPCSGVRPQQHEQQQQPDEQQHEQQQQPDEQQHEQQQQPQQVRDHIPSEQPSWDRSLAQGPPSKSAEMETFTNSPFSTEPFTSLRTDLSSSNMQSTRRRSSAVLAAMQLQGTNLLEQMMNMEERLANLERNRSTTPSISDLEGRLSVVEKDVSNMLSGNTLLPIIGNPNSTPRGGTTPLGAYDSAALAAELSTVQNRLAAMEDALEGAVSSFLSSQQPASTKLPASPMSKDEPAPFPEGSRVLEAVRSSRGLSRTSSASFPLPPSFTALFSSVTSRVQDMEDLLEKFRGELDAQNNRVNASQGTHRSESDGQGFAPSLSNRTTAGSQESSGKDTELAEQPERSPSSKDFAHHLVNVKGGHSMKEDLSVSGNQDSSIEEQLASMKQSILALQEWQRNRGHHATSSQDPSASRGILLPRIQEIEKVTQSLRDELDLLSISLPSGRRRPIAPDDASSSSSPDDGTTNDKGDVAGSPRGTDLNRILGRVSHIESQIYAHESKFAQLQAMLPTPSGTAAPLSGFSSLIESTPSGLSHEDVQRVHDLMSYDWAGLIDAVDQTQRNLDELNRSAASTAFLTQRVETLSATVHALMVRCGEPQPGNARSDPLKKEGSRSTPFSSDTDTKEADTLPSSVDHTNTAESPWMSKSITNLCTRLDAFDLRVLELHARMDTMEASRMRERRASLFSSTVDNLRDEVQGRLSRLSEDISGLRVMIQTAPPISLLRGESASTLCRKKSFENTEGDDTVVSKSVNDEGNQNANRFAALEHALQRLSGMLGEEIAKSEGNARSIEDLRNQIQELRRNVSKSTFHSPRKPPIPNQDGNMKDDAMNPLSRDFVDGKVRELEDALHSLSGRVDRCVRTLDDFPATQQAVSDHAFKIHDLQSNAQYLDLTVKAQGDDARRLQSSIDQIRSTTLSIRSGSNTAPGGTPGADGRTGATSGRNSGGDEEMENRFLGLADGTSKQFEWVRGQLIELRANLDHILRQKADGSVVASKAETDYVDASMRRLRHDVEDVMSNTNGTIIDTLDKSLSALRELVSTKANTTDLNKLKELCSSALNNQMNRSTEHGTSEGLIGLRCLSCNQDMKTMRPRSMGMNFASFMAHLNAPHAPPPAFQGGSSSQSSRHPHARYSPMQITALPSQQGTPPLPAIRGGLSSSIGHAAKNGSPLANSNGHPLGG